MASARQARAIVTAAICSAALAGLWPSVCSAEPPAEEPTSSPPLVDSSTAWQRWYGWQTFAADAAAGALFLSAVADDHSTTLFGLSGLTFGLGAPMIHVAHGRWDVGLGSLGLRFLGPFVGTAIGAQSDIRPVSDAPGSQDVSSKWAITGAAIGGLVASAIDGVLLAYDKPVPPTAPRKQLLQSEPLPQLMVLRHGILLGYSGQF